MQPFDMHWVKGVLHDLQPVTGHHSLANVTNHVIPHKKVVIRQERRRIRAEVRKDQACFLLHGVCLDRNPILERAIRVSGLLEWLLETASILIEEPPMICAAQALAFGDAKYHAGSAMRTAIPDESQFARPVPIKDEALPEQADRLRTAAWQL